MIPKEAHILSKYNQSLKDQPVYQVSFLKIKEGNSVNRLKSSHMLMDHLI